MTGPEDSAPQDGSAKDLKSWWSKFKQRKPKDSPVPGLPAPAVGAIFGVPLTTSIKYANVAISLMQEDGTSYTYGYIPIVVAKCGVFLKEQATSVEGIFRLAGSARRTGMLQESFNTEPTYGKNLSWTGYTVHDAANVLRRYLNQLPEPIVPLNLYEKFRIPLRQHQTQAVGNMEAKEADIGNFDYDRTIQTYRSLITQLPPLNRQLLLYILDMLAIFAAKSDVNHMTAANLAVIFQPGMLHHPSHDKLPHEYRLSQDVVIFLIDQQDNFLLGMPGTAADEKTKQEIEAGASAPQPGTPTRAAGVHRSMSTNSRSTNSSRLAGIRRNMSVSSRGSRTSQHNVPGTPGTPGTPGVHRSNTVPSRRSPAVSSSRFNKPSESPGATTSVAPEANTSSISPETGANTVTAITTGTDGPAAAVAAIAAEIPATQSQTSEMRTDSIAPSVEKTPAVRDQSNERLLGGESPATQQTNTRRGLAGFLRTQMSDDGQGKQPNKLRKRRQPSGAQPSGHSSAASLSADPENARSPLASPLHEPATSGDEGLRQVSGTSSGAPFTLTETAPTPRATTHPDASIIKGMGAPSPNGSGKIPSETATLKPVSEAAQTGQELSESNAETTDASIGPGGEGDSEKKKGKKRWRFSVSAKKSQEERQQQREQLAAAQASTSRLTNASDADLSKAGTSVSSLHHRRGSMANTDKPSLADSTSDSMARRSSRDIGSTDERSPIHESGEKGKGPIGWFKQKLAERKEKDDARDRAKSPRRSEQAARSASNVNIDAAANGDHPSRQRSNDVSEIIQEAKEESTEQPNITDRAPQSQPVSVTTGGLSASETVAKSSIHGSSIEDYMGDSDREKLTTAREVQAYLTKQDQEEKAAAAAAASAATSEAKVPAQTMSAGHGATAAGASNIVVDPTAQAGDASANGLEDLPTPKASEVNNMITGSEAAKSTETALESPKKVSEENKTTV